MIKNKQLFLLASLIISLLLSAHRVSALDFPFMGLTNTSSVGDLVVAIIKLAASVAFILAVISFLIGAVGLMVSGDSPELAGNSKDRMKGALLGLLLISSSYLILTTINTKFGNLTQAPLPTSPSQTPPTSPGVYFCLNTGCQNCSAPIGASVDSIGPSFNGKVAAIDIVDSPGINYGAILHTSLGYLFGGDCTYPITTVGCSPVSIPVSSADIFNVDLTGQGSGSGVSFYSEPFGTAIGSNAGFYKINSVASGSGMNIYDLNSSDPTQAMCFDYTNIKVPDTYMHKCAGSKCGARSLTCTSPSQCKAGETCDMSNPLGICKGTGDSAGYYCTTTPEDSCDTEDGDVCDMGSPTGTCKSANGVANCSPNACETFQDCPGSIEINGSWLVAAYSQDPNPANKGKTYCQTFTLNAGNLKNQPIRAPGTAKIDKIYIIATK